MSRDEVLREINKKWWLVFTAEDDMKKIITDEVEKYVSRFVNGGEFISYYFRIIIPYNPGNLHFKLLGKRKYPNYPIRVEYTYDIGEYIINVDGYIYPETKQLLSVNINDNRGKIN